MKKQIYTHYFIIMLLCIGLFGCTKLDIDNMDNSMAYEPSLAIPIGSVNATIEDILNIVDSNYIKTDAENNIYLAWSEKDLNLDFKIKKDFTAGEELENKIIFKETEPFDKFLSNSLITEIPAPIGETPFFKIERYPFGYNEHIDEEKEIYVDSMIITEANVDLTIDVEGININEQTYLEFDFTYPELTYIDKDQEHDTVGFSRIQIKKQHFTYNNKLFHVKAKFFNKNDNNKTKLVFNFKLINKDKNAKINSDAKIKFKTKINFINLDEAYGLYWQKMPYTDTEVLREIPTEFFNTSLIKNNRLLFSNPEIEMIVKSNVGIPIRCEVDSVYAIDEKGETHYTDFKGSTCYKVGVKKPEHPGDTTHTIIKLNRENGQTNRLFHFTPKIFHYTWRIYTEGKEGDSLRNHFLILPPEVKCDINAKMPFALDSTAQFTYKDTIEADMSSILQISGDSINNDSLNNNYIPLKIKTLNLYADIINNLPTKIDVNLIFLDEKNNALESLKPVKITIPSANVDNEGKVTSPLEQEFQFKNTEDDIDIFLKTKSIIIETTLKGFDDSSKICLQTTDFIKVKLNIFANTTISKPSKE